jgi:hypothetical protein
VKLEQGPLCKRAPKPVAHCPGGVAGRGLSHALNEERTGALFCQVVNFHSALGAPSDQGSSQMAELMLKVFSQRSDYAGVVLK